MTVPVAIKELEKIELVRINQGRYQLDHAVTKNQEAILRSFGLTKSHVISRAVEISETIANSLKDEQDDKVCDNEDDDEILMEMYDAEG